MLDDPRPIESLAAFARRLHGDDFAGTRPDGMNPRQTDHPRAEPAVAVGVFGVVEDLEQRFFRRGGPSRSIQTPQGAGRSGSNQDAPQAGRRQLRAIR